MIRGYGKLKLPMKAPKELDPCRIAGKPGCLLRSEGAAGGREGEGGEGGEGGRVGAQSAGARGGGCRSESTEPSGAPELFFP